VRENDDLPIAQPDVHVVAVNQGPCRRDGRLVVNSRDRNRARK
jgi:hypothetical protein